MATSYRTVIAFNYPEAYQAENGTTKYVDRMRYLPIDYLEDRSITANSRIVTQPLQNGDTMADHMYREPVKLSLKGKFSLHGRNAKNDSYDIMNNGDRLTNIQFVFEYIKNAGILCNITTVASETEGADSIYYDSEGNIINSTITPAKTRYLTRENMALTGISWTERVNSLDFSFNFDEVMMIDTEVYECDPTDYTIPSITSPKTQSVGTLLFDTGELPASITQTLYKKGYIQNDWLRALETAGFTFSVYLAVALTVAASVGIIVATTASLISGGVAAAAITGSAASIFPVGTIIAAAVVATAAIVIGIAVTINYFQEKEKERKAFRLINGKPDEDWNRYCTFMDDIEKAVNSVSKNISIYSFTENSEVQCTVPIGGNYYYITLTSTQNSPYWNSDIRVNGTSNNGGEPIKNKRGNFPVVTDFLEINENVNMWFRDEEKNYQVYLVNSSLAVKKTESERKESAKDLTLYSVWVFKGSAKEAVKAIQDAISDTIHAHDFD